jgi:hypothetical protein
VLTATSPVQRGISPAATQETIRPGSPPRIGSRGLLEECVDGLAQLPVVKFGQELDLIPEAEADDSLAHRIFHRRPAPLGRCPNPPFGKRSGQTSVIAYRGSFGNLDKRVLGKLAQQLPPTSGSRSAIEDMTPHPQSLEGIANTAVEALGRSIREPPCNKIGQKHAGQKGPDVIPQRLAAIELVKLSEVYRCELIEAGTVSGCASFGKS